MIQDLILTGCSLAFSTTQAQQVYLAHQNKNVGVPTRVLVMYALVVWTMAGTYASMTLPFTMLSVGVSALLWTTLLWMRIRYGK